MIAHATDEDEVLEVFRQNDPDDSGTVELHELATIMRRIEPNKDWSDRAVRRLLTGMGLPCDGAVNYRDFLQAVFAEQEGGSQRAAAAVVVPLAPAMRAGPPGRLAHASVYVRIRPTSSDGRTGHTDGEAGRKHIRSWDDTSVTMQDDDRGEQSRTEVTRVLGPEVEQEEAFLAVAPEWLDTFTSDGNVICFAYGQTGSGKTHTMLGEVESLAAAEPVPGWGIFPRVVHATLERMRQWRSQGRYAVLVASAVEFYCGAAFDLNSDPLGKSEVTLDGNANLFGTRSKEITSTRQLKKWIMRMYANRTTASTKMNDKSSRSHCAFVLTLHQLREDDTYVKTTLSLIDMAGSERSSKTGVDRVTKDEAANEMTRMFEAGTPERISLGTQAFIINFELSFIQTELLKASDCHKRSMPYKAAKEASTAASFFYCANFDGRSRVGALVTVSQSPQHGFETWFSLRFAQQMAECRVPLKRVVPQPWDKALQDATQAAEEAAQKFERWGPNPSPQGAKQYRVLCLQSGAATYTAQTLECLHKLEDYKSGQAVPEEPEDAEESDGEWPPPPLSRPKRVVARPKHKSALEMGKVNENFAVFVRVRPLLQREITAGAENCLTITDIDFPRDPPPQRITVKEGGRSKGAFVFDRVFDNSFGQEAIYAASVKSYVSDFLGGTNVTIFAYGQTGTGKTHTIAGPSDDPGIVTRCLEDLFRELPATGKELHYEYVQLYCRELKDLLVRQQTADLKIVERSDGSVFVQNLSSHPATTADEVLGALATGAQRRATRAQDMNSVSSRSHAILMLRLVDPGKEVSECSASMFIVDLAGSERIARSGVTGQGFDEATAINGSLSNLGRVVVTLIDRDSSFIPYNGDPLTLVLKGGLGGNSKTALIACVTQAADSLTESLSTLRFAMQASHVKNKVEKKEAKDQAEQEGAKIAEAGHTLTLDEAGVGRVSLTCGELDVLGNMSAGPEASMVLIIAGGAAYRDFAPLGAALTAAGFRWLVPCFPGEGNSTGTRCSEKPDKVLDGSGPDVVVELLDWVGVPKAHIVGIDWGTLVTVGLLTLHPKRVGKYIMVCEWLKHTDPMKATTNMGMWTIWWAFLMDERLRKTAQKIKKTPARFYWPTKTVGGKRVPKTMMNQGADTAKLFKGMAVTDNYEFDMAAMGREIARAFSK